MFIFSYTVSIKIIGDKNLLGYEFLEKTKATISSGLINEPIDEKTKIKFYIKYDNCLDVIESHEFLDRVEGKERERLIGLSEKELENIFSNFGYKLDRLTKEEVIFTKEIKGYEYINGSYFIGMKDNKLVIYKKDGEQSIRVVENEITNPRSESEAIITIEDIENKNNLLQTLYEGRKDYEFSNIQEAIDRAKSFCSWLSCTFVAHKKLKDFWILKFFCWIVIL